MALREKYKNRLFRFLLEHFSYTIPKKTNFSGWYGRLLYRSLICGLLIILLKTQFLPRTEIEKLQVTLLRKVLKDAQRRALFWQIHFQKHSFDPSSVSSLEDLTNCPFITKKDLQGNMEDVTSSKNIKLPTTFRLFTSGSTGTPTPVTVYYSYYTIYRTAIKLRAWLSTMQKLFRETVWSKSILLVNISMYYLRWNTYHVRLKEEIIKQNLPALFELISKKRIKIICTTPGFLLWFRKTFPAKALRNAGIKLISVGGEHLSNEMQYELEAFFDIPILHSYGMREVGEIARECPVKRGTHHIHSEFLIVEIVDNNGNQVKEGTTGEIVVTSLSPDAATPIIRYKTGDMGCFKTGRCGCGITSKRLLIQGRSVAMVCLPSGAQFPSLMLTSLFADEERTRAFSQFQIIQEQRDVLTVFIVPHYSKLPSSDDITQLSQHIQRRCNNEKMHINVRIVDSIPVSKTGKTPSFISQLSPSHVAPNE